MADPRADRQDLLEEDCIAAFRNGNKPMAEQLLTRIRPAVVRTTLGSLSSLEGEFRREVSLLHLSAYWGWKDIAVRLVAVHNCSAMWMDDQGHISLHYAAYYGHLEVVKYFTGELHCDPMDRTMGGNTPLHYACQNGHLNIVQYLINEVHCDPSCENIVGYVPLHYACTNGHLNIAKYLISEAHCDPSCEDNSGDTPLHLACSYSHSNIIQYLISEVHCNPSCVNKRGSTPLHIACGNYSPLNIIRYLISEALCNPSCEDNNGYTPLHCACVCGKASVVKYILSTGRVNPLAEDIRGHTPLYYATGNYDIIKLFQPFIDCSRDFPVHTFTKLILAGDSGAGKTTIAQLIKLLANRASSAVTVDCVADVQCFTAGIIPHYIKSELGNFIVYDFAGQQEYYSSHAAILEHVMRKSAAMFFCMIDLSKSIDNISQSLHYWLTFIDNACSTAEETSHVAIIGSHADQIASLDLEEKSLLLQTIAAKRVKSQRYVGCITMDCRLANTEDSCRLVSLLIKSQKAIAVSRPAISYYCHVLYAFLHTRLEVVGCSLEDLMSIIAEESDSILPNDLSVLSELLTTLSDKGLIIFINNSESSSWVVAKVEALLNEIDGTLFAPPHFKEYRNLASNTGIVPTSNLQKVFPLHNLEMVIGFLVSLNFCRPVDPSALQYTNLQTTPSHSTVDLLFFPGLVESERPDSLTLHGTLHFGWCLGCLDPNQFFGSRFLHLLLLSVAYRFPLPARCSTTSSLCGLQRRCTVWKNGISWRDFDSITTVIELINKNRWVLVATSCSEDRPVEFAKLRSELISLVHHLQEERCQSLEVCECLISPSLVQRYPFDDLPDTDLFDIQDVAYSMLCRKPSICSLNKDCIGHLSTESLPFEPYHLISPSYVCQLFNSDAADQPVPVPLLQVVRTLCNQSKMKPLVYKKLRECLDGLSIFAGRNPLVCSNVTVAILLLILEFCFYCVYRKWLG